ncbi:MAG: hypothetical protein R3C18_14075 [Planctomycetaceae bacterium]
MSEITAAEVQASLERQQLPPAVQIELSAVAAELLSNPSSAPVGSQQSTSTERTSEKNLLGSGFRISKGSVPEFVFEAIINVGAFASFLTLPAAAIGGLAQGRSVFETALNGQCLDRTVASRESTTYVEYREIATPPV